MTFAITGVGGSRVILGFFNSVMFILYYLESSKTCFALREAFKNYLADSSAKGGGHNGENHSFWLLKRFLIFQGISWDLDVNVLKHISVKIML